MQRIGVSQDRTGALTDEGGSTPREVESRVEVRLDMDSENDSVTIDSVDDPVPGVVVPDVARAADRGFAPEDVMAFLSDDVMMFELIDIDRHTRDKNDMRRQEGRFIGENGRTHKLMEELTGVDVVIYDTTLGITSQPGGVEVVHRAVEMILDSAPHGAVYSFLERKHNELTQSFNVQQNS